MCSVACSDYIGLFDPCLSGNYVELNEPHRSEGYVLPRSDTHSLCDSQLQNGWYRFTSLAGGRMPDHCVDRFHCGTHAPIWLNGTHPDVGDGVVDRMVCANLGGYGPHPERVCCDAQLDVGVKNCGSFYVYFLRATPSCPVAYCAGSAEPCPAGKSSPTGFTPCIEPPGGAPKLNGPEVLGRTFRFTCNVDFPLTDPDVMVEVAWTFDGQEDINIPHSAIGASPGKAVLPGSSLRDHMGTDVGCKIRTFSVSNRNLTSAWTDSNTYWAGIRPDREILEVSEKEGPQNITLTSTVPMVCDHDRSCCLTLALDIDGPKNNLAIPNSCQYNLCSTDWNNATNTASVTIPVLASRDNIKDGDKSLEIHFNPVLTAGGGSYLAAFDTHQIAPVKVVAKDEITQTCSGTGDPHFHGMEYSRTFHLFDVGDYTLYQNPDRNFEVQVRTWPCGSSRHRVACICGLAIREQSDVVRISQCDQRYGDRHTSPVITSLRRRLREFTRIQRSSDGHHITVTMPSGFGMQVSSNSKSMDTHMLIPSTDNGRARGICGTFDGNRNNEFTHRGGQVELHPPSRPQAFTNSWSNHPAQSLFQNVPANMNTTQEERYCSCDDTGSQATVDCTKTAEAPTQRMQVGNSGWSKRSAIYEDEDEVDPPFNPQQYQTPEDLSGVGWPTPSGITEEKAKEECDNALQKAQLFSHCGHKEDMKTNTLDDCVVDILYTDSLDFVESAVSSFTTQCQMELSNDPNNYVTSPDGKNVLKPEISSEVCSIVCLRHGHCERGNCVCEAGYTGANCQLEANKGPQLNRIRGNFEMSDNFHCAIREVMPDGSLSSTPHIEPAELLSSGRLACPLPDARVKK
ncbi:hypothetical protein BaRGS_00024514, partial [Batillaria attramentaria]